MAIIAVMADADEDTIPRGGASGEDGDLTDETQDFRFLASISYVNSDWTKEQANNKTGVKMQQYQNEAKRTSSLMQLLYNRIL